MSTTSKINNNIYYWTGNINSNIPVFIWAVITVTEIKKDKIAFDILSVTREPSRNIAQIETDTVLVSGDEFIYKVPYSNSCIFKVKFFKDFVSIDYVKHYRDCRNVFGLNAGVDGIFYRINK